jgi:hypothetical protein
MGVGGIGWASVKAMAQVTVTCSECGLRGALAQSGQEFSDPGGRCKHSLSAARCPSLRIPLMGARRVLENLEWNDFLATGEEIRIPAACIEFPPGAGDAPEVTTVPLVAQDSTPLAPTVEPDALPVPEQLSRARARNGAQ